MKVHTLLEVDHLPFGKGLLCTFMFVGGSRLFLGLKNGERPWVRLLRGMVCMVLVPLVSTGIFMLVPLSNRQSYVHFGTSKASNLDQVVSRPFGQLRETGEVRPWEPAGYPIQTTIGNEPVVFSQTCLVLFALAFLPTRHQVHSQVGRVGRLNRWSGPARWVCQDLRTLWISAPKCTPPTEKRWTVWKGSSLSYMISWTWGWGILGVNRQLGDCFWKLHAQMRKAARQ